MSFFSRSSSKRPYRNGYYGSTHYQRKGVLGKLFNMLRSKSYSGRYYEQYPQQYPQQYPNQPIPNNPSNYRNTLNCTKCNSLIPTGSKFCLECGQKVNDVLFCINCGEPSPAHAKFCLKCGVKINN